MCAAIALGLELPALTIASTLAAADHRRSGLRDPTSGAAEAWRGAAKAAEAAGFGAVWVSSSSGGRDRTCDPCTLAASLVPATSNLVLGVVAGLSAADRVPSVLARDITTIDVMSNGRAALLVDAGCRSLAPDAPGEGDPGSASAAARMTAEAIAVCRLLFSPEPVSFQGTHYRLRDAVNRPAPCRPGGPLLLAVLTPGDGTSPLAGAGQEPDRSSVPGDPDAWVVSGDPDEVATACDGLDRARAGGLDRARAADQPPAKSRPSDAPGGPGRSRPGVVWRGALPHPGRCATLVADLRDAGADGMIVRLAGGDVPSPEAVVAAARLLVPLLRRRETSRR